MHQTPQEFFWTGQFGNEYIARNQGDERIAAKINLFSKILSRTENLDSVVEFGANIGLNLIALRALRPKLRMTGIEINEQACRQLAEISGVETLHQSILDFETDRQWDMTLIKTVLIHINPDFLPRVYEKLYACSKRYVCVVEYYNPSPTTVSYRGHEERLFKRDFAGEMLERYPDLRLLDYGFVYKRDPNFALDDVTWFLLEKTGAK